MPSPLVSVRVAAAADAVFVRDMARHAATLEDRGLPPPEADEVAELLPSKLEDALIATALPGQNLGAAWWRTGAGPLVPALPKAPELCMAVAPDARGQGVGTALLAALLQHAELQGHPTLVLNVHLRNTAALHLYMNNGFRVTAAGRGWFGVAMACNLGSK